MRQKIVQIVKVWVLRQITFAPLVVLLFMGFRTGAEAMTPEARWHPAFKWAGPLALAILAGLASGLLPFDPMGLGMLLFIVVGAAGVLGLRHGFDAIHLAYAPMAQAMLFVWIAAVFAALALFRPALALRLAPPIEAQLKPQVPARARAAAWTLVAAALAATGASWLLRTHEALAGLLPFLGLMWARIMARRWAAG